jgi:excisionase family DNA binding protein
VRSINQRAQSETDQSLTLTAPQAAELLGISVSNVYEAARAGDLATVKVSARALVSRRRLEELIDGPAVTPHSRPKYDRAIANATEQRAIETNVKGARD